MALQETHRTSTPRITTNALSNLVLSTLDMLIQLVLLRFILGILAPDIYGIWAITGGIFAYSSILQLGLNSAINYFVPPLLIRNDHDGINRILSTAVVYYAAISLLVLVATILLTIYFPTWFRVTPELATSARWVVALVGGYLIFSIPLLAFQGLLSGMQEYASMNKLRIVFRLLRALLIVLLMKSGWGIIGLAIAHVFSRSAEAAAMPFLARRRLPQINIHISLASLKELRELLSYSIQTLIWSISFLIRDRASVVIAGALLSASAATLYAIPLLVLQALYSIAQSLAAVTKPAATAFQETGSHDRIRELVLRGNRIMGLFVFPAVITLVLLGREILVLWIGTENYLSSATLLTIMAIGESLTLSQMVSAYAMIGIGKHNAFARFALLSAFISLILMIGLIFFTNLGLNAIALGSAIPSFLGGLLFIPFYTPRTIQSSLILYWWNSLLRPMLASLPFALALYISTQYIHIVTLSEMLRVILIMLPVFAAGIYFLGLTHTDRLAVRTTVMSWLSMS